MYYIYINIYTYVFGIWLTCHFLIVFLINLFFFLFIQLSVLGQDKTAPIRSVITVFIFCLGELDDLLSHV